MAVTFVAAGTVASGTGAITVGLPSGIQNDDLLLLLCESANQSVATPSGWLDVPSAPQGVGTAGGTAATVLEVFYRWVDGTETDASVADPGDHVIGRMIAYRGVDRTTPFNTSAGSTKATASTTVTFPSVTTTVDDCMVLLMEAHALPDANSTAVTSGQTMASLASVTERLDNNTNAGNGGGFSLAEGIKATAGATGTGSATLTTSSVGAHITLALTPAPEAQDVLPDLYENANTFYTHTTTAGPVTLAADRFDNEQTFYTHVVSGTTPGQDVLPDRYDNAQTFYTHTVVAGAVTLAPARFDNTQTYFAHSITTGPVTLSPLRFDNANTFYTHAVQSGSIFLAPDRYDNANTFYQHTVAAGTATLAPARFDNASTFYQQAVTRGPVTLTAARFDNANTLYPATVAIGAVTLTPARFDNASTFYQHTVTALAPTLAPQRLDNANTFYQHSITGATTLAADRFDNSNEFYAPNVVWVIKFYDWVEPGHVEPGWVEWSRFNTNQFFPATVEVGAVSVEAGFFENTNTFFVPRVRRTSDVQTQILQLLRNRQELDPVTGTFTVYDDDGVTPLWAANAWEDAAGTIPYSGKTLSRIDRLELQ